ncbi:hypothetical protein NC653_027708 [Populus alba x Populus x berolinensis]|uniref:Uncharacterized protein n=1 Tax=Populus alba x Populus x berolinensis TaxID=444605 RepID=A0AAD6Q5D9_9ROSI|nr:hypothetical protein NC653_027708 [Populus alba x Populus x berolinensis]
MTYSFSKVKLFHNPSKILNLQIHKRNPHLKMVLVQKTKSKYWHLLGVVIIRWLVELHQRKV